MRVPESMSSPFLWGLDAAIDRIVASQGRLAWPPADEVGGAGAAGAEALRRTLPCGVSAPHSAFGVSSGYEINVALKIQRPTSLVTDAIPFGFPTRSVAIQVTMLQLHSSSVRPLGDEPDLDFARLARVSLDLPLRLMSHEKTTR